MAATSGTTAPELSYPRFEKHFTEFVGVGANGHLWVEGRDCVELAETFGTPLYVLSESQLRHNLRRFRAAFESRYPAVDVLFANKSNNGLAVRHVVNQEGVGGDCFGVNELYLALLAGTDPLTLVLNGSNKSDEELEMAVRNGVCVNLDALDELDRVDATATRLGRKAEIGIRVKLELKALEERFGTAAHGEGSLAEQGRNHKWGMPFDQTVEMVKRVRANMPNLKLKEISYHLGRASNVPDDFAHMVRELIGWCARLRDETGWTPPHVDIGGGWAWGRPEGTGPGGEDGETTPTYEDFAAAACGAIADECAKFDLPLPGLRIEPGRSISASIGIALGRVGAVKEWPAYGKTWVNVDCSTNHLIRIPMAHWYHHIVAANKAAEPVQQAATTVVGPLCSLDHLGDDRSLPSLERGDLIALLDTGSYGESTAANYNAQPRPATVMVSGEAADVTTVRESRANVIGRYQVPPRLLAGSFAGG